MKIHVRIQESIAHGWVHGDSGKDIFVVCIPALERVLRRKVAYGEEFLLDIPSVREIEKGKH